VKLYLAGNLVAKRKVLVKDIPRRLSSYWYIKEDLFDEKENLRTSIEMKKGLVDGKKNNGCC
jgi:hypothetical protein